MGRDVNLPSPIEASDPMALHPLGGGLLLPRARRGSVLMSTLGLPALVVSSDLKGSSEAGAHRPS